MTPTPLFLQIGAGYDYCGMMDDHRERHIAYCNKYGYDYENHEMPWLEQGAHMWYRIPLIIEKIESGQWSHIFVLDADVIVMDDSADMRDALGDNAWLAMTIHPYPGTVDVWHFNGGAMYIRCCQESLAFFQKVHETYGVRIYQNGCVDQFAIQDVLINGPSWCQDGFRILSHRWNNNMHDQPNHKPIVAAFHGFTKASDRRALMKYYVKHVADYPKRTYQVDGDEYAFDINKWYESRQPGPIQGLTPMEEVKRTTVSNVPTMDSSGHECITAGEHRL